MFKALNVLDYAGASLGNHEFNYGLDFLRLALASVANFMSSTIVPSCMKSQDGFVVTHVAGEGSARYSAGLHIPSAE